MSRAKGEYLKLLNTTRWRKIRATHLDAHPFCAECLTKGVLMPADCVHHITPVESATSVAMMERLAYDMQNLQSLCNDCHAAIHKALRSHTKAEMKQRNRKKADEFSRAAYGIDPGVDF